VPNCDGKACGGDGCGGSCGTCAADEFCNAANQCIPGCAAQCNGKQCGPDGCGGSCGTCPANHLCLIDGTCFCDPDCDGKDCGPDGCGGVCGTCSGGQQCLDQQCFDVGVGACTDEEDAVVWTVDLTYLRGVLTDCGLECYFQGQTKSCAKSCVGLGLTVGDDCLDCYADTVVCAMQKCGINCTSGFGGAQCNQCLANQGCIQAHDACTGNAPL